MFDFNTKFTLSKTSKKISIKQQSIHFLGLRMYVFLDPLIAVACLDQTADLDPSFWDKHTRAGQKIRLLIQNVKT